MILTMLALQAAATTTRQWPAPRLEGAAWHYLGRSNSVAHYADANSARRQGTRAVITHRIIYFNGTESDEVSHLFIDCTQNFGVKGDRYDVRNGTVHPRPRGILEDIRLQGEFYDVIGTAIAIACEGRSAVPVADPVRDAVARGREVSRR